MWELIKDLWNDLMNDEDEAVLAGLILMGIVMILIFILMAAKITVENIWM